MNRIGFFAVAALLAAIVWTTPNRAAAWPWNSQAKKPDSQAEPSEKPKPAAPPRNAEDTGKEATKLKQAARSASHADKATAQRSPSVSGKPIWSPVSSRYRWDAAQKQPTPARRALNGTVNALTLKPLRDKLSGNPTKSNPWSTTPPVTNTSNRPRQSAFSSLFKPKPKPKTGPQTVGEWINQQRPAY